LATVGAHLPICCMCLVSPGDDPCLLRAGMRHWSAATTTSLAIMPIDSSAGLHDAVRRLRRGLRMSETGWRGTEGDGATCAALAWRAVITRH
jgi:hypothetical protein